MTTAGVRGCAGGAAPARGALADLKYARSGREQAEADMIALLSGLGVDAGRICEIPGLSPVTLAAILAETGDLHTYESSAPVVKHAGMSAARNESGSFRGQAKISRRGALLRLAAWRATWAVLRHCGVLAAKHAALTSRDDDSKLIRRTGPCGVRRVAAALDLVADGARHPMGCPDRRRRARPPPRHGRITAGQAASQAHASSGPREHHRPFPHGGASRLDVEDHLAGNPGQLPPARPGPSPARLNAAGTPSPLELRRAQEPRAATARNAASPPPGRASQGARQHARKQPTPRPAPPPEQTRHARSKNSPASPSKSHLRTD